MLTEAQSAPLRGFITDLEFARIESPTLLKPQRTVAINVGTQNKYDDQGHVHSRTEPTTRTHTTFESTVTVKRGAGMTVSYFYAEAFLSLRISQGTAQFMAWRILLHEIDITMQSLVDEAAYDVESFIWVLSCSVMRNLYHRAFQRSASKEIRDERVTFRSLFSQAFGQTTSRYIAYHRHSRAPCLAFPRDKGVNKTVSSFMSNGLVSLFRGLQSLIHLDTDPYNPIPLSHDALLRVINNTIDVLDH